MADSFDPLCGRSQVYVQSLFLLLEQKVKKNRKQKNFTASGDECQANTFSHKRERLSQFQMNNEQTTE